MQGSYDGHFVAIAMATIVYICERLHIQKCLLGINPHLYQFWCFYIKMHSMFILDYAAALLENLEVVF